MANSKSGDWLFPLMLSCLAGASTSVGAGIVFVFSASKIRQSMPFSLSLAASVMITVSVISIGPECLEGAIEYDPTLRVDSGLLFQRIASFALGCGSYYLLSRLLAALPEPESFVTASPTSPSPSPSSLRSPVNADFKNNDEEMQHPLASTHYQEDNPRRKIQRSKVTNSSSPTKVHRGAIRRSIAREHGHSDDSSNDGHEERNSCDSDDDKRKISVDFHPTTAHPHEDRRRSWRVTMLLFISLLCHNFPEGLAVVASTVESRELGVTVAIGIALHNIPEGIAIAVPCMAARPDAPWLAFGLASVSGLAEPLGAMLALSVLQSSSNEKKGLPLENMLACVAGIMCMVAVIELYPEAYRQVHHREYQGMLWGTVLGMFIMIATEWYLP